MMHKRITELLPRRVELAYVDYRDNLDERKELIQECLHKNEWYPLDEEIMEWYTDSEYESENYYLKELAKDLVRTFDVDEERAERFVEEHDEELRDLLRDRDESDTLHDLLRNTRPIVAFYDTGYEFDETCFLSTQEFTAERARLRRALRIVGKHYDKLLSELLANASYGGRLVIYFQIDPEDFIGKPGNTIAFSDPNVAIIDTYNGSGHHVHLAKHELTLAYERTNLFLDETIKYNYTFAVCGMAGNWCEDTDAKLITRKRTRKPVASSLNVEAEREAQYNATFKVGGCTFGDMDMKRHRKTYYLNEYPCGTHCPTCQTFWID